MNGVPQQMAKLLYGRGLRLGECLDLRVKDVVFGNRQTLVRGGKGEKDRVTVCSGKGYPCKRLERRIWRNIIVLSFGEKYQNSLKDFLWQYIFPTSV